MAVIVHDGAPIINTLKKKTVATFRRKTPNQNATFLSMSQSQDFSIIYDSSDTQSCAGNLYKILQSMLDKFYPKRTITVTDCDPPFITPEVKHLLREKNREMKQGHLEHAGALATKIGKIIAKYNFTRLSNISPSGTKDLWSEVRRLTGASTKNTIMPSTFSADILNNHATISSDPLYTVPLKKAATLTSVRQQDPVNDYAVFCLLDKLKSTASGLDEIPSWFLRVGAPVLCSPIAHLFQMSINSSVVPLQWKSAVIHPIPKISSPLQPSDMRPISVLPVISRKLVSLNV